MTWVKLDDQFFRNPKVLRCSPGAKLLHLAGMCWLGTHRGEQTIPAAALSEIARTAPARQRDVDELLNVGLWENVPDGYAIAGWSRRMVGGGRRIPVPQWLRRWVIERDGFICGLCGGEVEPKDVHIDHVIPVALGGRNEPDNLQVAHSRCNLRKGASA